MRRRDYGNLRAAKAFEVKREGSDAWEPCTQRDVRDATNAKTSEAVTHDAPVKSRHSGNLYRRARSK